MYERILVPVDGSTTSAAGLAEAIKLAKLTGAQIRLLHVVDDMPLAMTAQGSGVMTADLLTLLREAGQQTLQAARERVAAAGIAVDAVIFDSLAGRVSDRVAEQAGEWNADLIVLGTHGRRGVGRMLLGSDAEQVLRTSPVPVLLVRAPEPG
jgi:nucleotide-binding universal stress UspA family protein